MKGTQCRDVDLLRRGMQIYLDTLVLGELTDGQAFMLELLTEKGHFVCDDKCDATLLSLQDQFIAAKDRNDKITILEQVISLLQSA